MIITNLKRFGFFVLAICLFLILPGSVQALDPEQRRLIDGGILHFDYRESCGSAIQRPGSSKIYIIGDSLTVGMRDSGDLQRKLTDNNWIVQGIEATEGDTISDALPKLAVAQDTGTVLVGLGTNTEGNFGNKVGEMVAKIKEQSPNAKIVWINAYTRTNNYDAANDALAAKSVELGFTIIDWRAEAQANATVYDFASDGIHSSGTGYQARADFIVRSLGQPVSTGSIGAGGSLSSNVPEQWRNLILEAAPVYPDVDPQIVAAVLYVENNSWPEYRASGWPRSRAGAAGPFQFIPQTWFGWNTGISSWGREFDNSAYSSSGMGTDGDGDGRRDPDNPKDAVHAAFKHHRGSAGKPVAVRGYNQGAQLEANMASTIFERTDTNLLYYASKYNGSGARSGSTIEGLRGSGENGNYVVAVFALLASDFSRAFDYPNNQLIDIDGTVAGAGSSGGGAICTTESGGSGDSAISAEGFAFPLQTTKSVLRQNGSWSDSGPAKNTHPYTAIDINIPTGTIVVAARAGEVITEPKYDGRGTAIGGKFQIRGEDGLIYYYNHLGNNSWQEFGITKGTKVVAGQKIGKVGTAEDGAGTPHLHIDAIRPPPGVNTRGACSRSGCPISSQFVDISNVMNEAYKLLPE